MKIKMLINRVIYLIIFCCNCMLVSCMLPGETRHGVLFKNCTNDTLFIGVSRCNHIDSVSFLIEPFRNIADSVSDTLDISLWGRKKHISKFLLYPDSMGLVIEEAMFNNNKKNTCYFFLIKLRDAMKFSWDEIRTKKLYRKWFVTKDSEGKYDTEIKYID